MPNQPMEGVENPYLEGNFAPVTEEVTATDLQVEGELPKELNGRYLRNGPNPIDLASRSNHHWFVGSGWSALPAGRQGGGNAIVMLARES